MKTLMQELIKKRFNGGNQELKNWQKEYNVNGKNGNFNLLRWIFFFFCILTPAFSNNHFYLSILLVSLILLSILPLNHSLLHSNICLFSFPYSIIAFNILVFPFNFSFLYSILPPLLKSFVYSIYLFSLSLFFNPPFHFFFLLSIFISVYHFQVSIILLLLSIFSLYHSSLPFNRSVFHFSHSFVFTILFLLFILWILFSHLILSVKSFIFSYSFFHFSVSFLSIF